MDERSEVAARDASEAMRRLGIKGTKVTSEIGPVIKIITTFPDPRTYWRNSERFNNKSIELMDRYPDVKFYFDVEFFKH